VLLLQNACLITLPSKVWCRRGRVEKRGSAVETLVDTSAFVDGIGRRLRAPDANGEAVETLRLCRELSEAASTEAALIERAGRLATFTHPAFAPVRRVERLHSGLGGLAVVSVAVPGVRLSEVLRNGHRKGVAPDFDAVASLLEQITGALGDFHRRARDLAHGTIGPERIVVRPDGRAVIVEPVLAPALEQLQMRRTPLWHEFRVAVPAVAGMTRFDQMTDVLQLGVLALALVLGRPLRRDEYPHGLQDVLAEASAPDPLGERRTLSKGLRSWILRMLQSEARSAFRTAAEAATALEAVLAEEPRHKAGLPSVVRYLAACSSGADADLSSSAMTSAPAAVDPGPARSAADGIAALAGPEPLTSELVAWVPLTERDAPDAPAEAWRVSRLLADAVRASRRYARSIDWNAVRRGVSITLVSAGLAALFGVTYLGARGYLGLPNLIGGRGTLVVDSRPAGIDVFVDGFPGGRTPATLVLSAGEHTLVLRTASGVTLVPVVVVAGARRVEFVEVRSHRFAPRAQTAPHPPSLPSPRLPQ
jgi:PEGA domain